MHVGDPAGGRLKFLGCSQPQRVEAVNWLLSNGAKVLVTHGVPPLLCPWAGGGLEIRIIMYSPCRHTSAVPPLPEAVVSAPLSTILA